MARSLTVQLGTWAASGTRNAAGKERKVWNVAPDGQRLAVVADGEKFNSHIVSLRVDTQEARDESRNALKLALAALDKLPPIVAAPAPVASVAAPANGLALADIVAALKLAGVVVPDALLATLTPAPVAAPAPAAAPKARVKSAPVKSAPVAAPVDDLADFVAGLK